SSFRSLTDKLGVSGELISSLPGAAAQADAIGFKLIFATGSKESEVEEVARPFRGRVEKIGPSLRRRAEAALKRTGRPKKSTVEEGGVDSTYSRPGRLDKSVDLTEGAESGQDLGDEPGPGASAKISAASVAQATAQEFLQPLSAGVRIDLTQIDEISSLAHELNIEAQKLSAMAGRVMAQPEIGARDRFDLKQSSRRLQRNFLQLD